VDLGLHGKVALVGASSKGLGKASALALACEGARVTICARNRAHLEAAADEIRRETHARVLAVPADLTKAEDIHRVVAATVENIDLSNGIRPGIAGLMKAIMPDLAKDGITINLVLPGMFLTSRILGGLADGTVEIDRAVESQIAASIPMGRLGRPIELGQLVAFLASEQAAYITGAVYQVDGGKIKSNL